MFHRNKKNKIGNKGNARSSAREATQNGKAVRETSPSSEPVQTEMKDYANNLIDFLYDTNDHLKRAMICQAGEHGNGIEVNEVTGDHTKKDNKESNKQDPVEKHERSTRIGNAVHEPSPPFEPVRNELRDFSNCVMNFSADFFNHSFLNNIKMKIKGVQYTPNYCFKDKSNSRRPSKYFFFNENRLTDMKGKFPEIYMSATLNRQEFMKYDDQEFVIRAFRFGGIDSKYVFSEEAVEIIRLALMKQGSAHDYSKLNSFSIEWDTHDTHLSSCIPKSRFKELLSEFNVDQSSITIIPDATYSFQYEKSFRETLYPVTLMNCDGKLVMSNVNAMFYIFQSVACGRTWTFLNENPHVQNFTKTFYKVMDEYLELNDGMHVALEKVQNDISILKECVKANELDETTLDYFFEKYAHSDQIPLKLHVKNMKALGLGIPPSNSGNSVIPAHKFRSIYLAHAINLFCEPKMIKLKLKLVDGISTKIPWSFLKQHVVLSKRLMISQAGEHGNGIEVDEVTGNHTINKECNEQVSASIQSSDTAAVHQETGTPTDGIDAPSDMTATSRNDQCNEEEEAENSTKSSEASSEPPLTRIPTSTLPLPTSTACESSCQTDPPLSSCFTCSKNIKLRSDAQEEARTAKNSLKKCEYNAKQAESRAKELKVKEKEVQELKTTVEERDNEIKRLKEELQKKSEKVEVLEESIKEKDAIIEKEQQETIEAKGKNASLRRRVEELQLKFAVEQSKVDQMIEKCKNIQQCPTSSRSRVSRNDEPSTSEPSTSQLPPRAVLHQWQKLKDDLSRDKLLDEQKELIENLINTTTELHVQRFAEYELVRFEGTRSIYLQTIEMNIAKIKKTDDTTSLLPLPEYPKLSTSFLDYYQKELENQPKPIAPGFDPNVECYMCLEEFSDDNDKFFGWKCIHPAHFKCAETWKWTQLEAMNMRETACGYCRKIEEEEKLRKTKNKKKAKK